MNWTANNHFDRIQFSKAAVSVFLTRDWWHKHKYPHQTGLAPDLSVRSWCNTHTHTRLILATCIFPILCLSIFLSLSLWMRSWQLAANVCHHSAHFSAWQGSVLGHTHTPQSVSSRLAGGSRVEAARKIPKYLLPNFSQRKNYLTLYKLSVCVCVSADPAWHSMWMTIWHCGLSSRRHLVYQPCVIMATIGSNLWRGWWWAGAASVTAHSSNMFQPSVVYFPSISLYLSLLWQRTHSGLATLVPPPVICTLGQTDTEETEEPMVLHNCTQAMLWVRAVIKYYFHY